AGVDDPVVAQHAEGGGRGAEIHHADGLVHAFVRHLVGHQPAGVLQGIGLDVHNLGVQPGNVQHRLARLDVLAAGRRQQHVHHLGVVGRGADDLVIEANFFKREGNVLVRLQLDLLAELLVGQCGGHGNQLGNDGSAANGHGGVLDAGAGALDRFANRVADRLDVLYYLVHDRIGRHGLGRVGLYAVPVPGTADLDQL